MPQPPAKRLKISRGEDDYMPGSIIEIELYNFMTFNQLKCKPGSRLNLVIGPNGSGKSSIVCAIALGLGGEPQLLGRATNVGAFVKRGEESGYIKITLRGETKEEQIAITRKIDTRNRSEWWFNGKVAPKKEVSEIIQRFNIQVNNLTQFLPQDRVCEFAKLTPVQLLEETEKAIGDTQLPGQHCALVEKSREIKNIERAVEKNGDTLNQLRALNAELEKDVKRVRQREILLAKAESMKKKLPWLKYDIKKVEYIELKGKENESKKKLDEAAMTLNGLKEPIEKHKKEKAMVDAKSKKISHILNNNTRKQIELLENENHLGVEVQGKYKEMGDLRKQEESRQQRIIQAKEELVAAELELQNLRPYCIPREEIERLASQIMDLELSANQKRLSKTESEKVLAQKRIALRQCMDRLKDMESKHTKLLQALENSGADKISDAYHWLQEHRHDFNKEVYGPILLEVNISNQIHADYLESQTPYYIWKSFVTQDSNDRDHLVKCFKSFDVPILNYVDEGSRKEKFEITEEMCKLGIYSRLDQVFDAPNSVKEVLISQFALDRSYIGSKETDQKADAVSKYGILDFWTPENHYHWSVSRYGDHMTGNVEPVERSRLLLCNKNVGEIDGLRSRKSELEESVAALEESHKSFQIEIKNIENETAKLRKQREDIISIVHQEKRKRQEMENRINQRKKKLESMTQEEDLETLIAKLNDQAASISIQRFRCAIEIMNLLVDTVSHRQSSAQHHLSSIEFDAKIRDMEFNMKKQEKDAMQASLHFENCKKEVEDCRQQLSVAKRHAESIAVITPELKQDFLEMPTTIEELENAIQDNISQANSILFLNHNILEEYEHRQSQIRSIATKLETDQEELKRWVTEVDDLKKNWLPALRNLVSQINETFSHNFQEMAVAGEVSLDEHGMDFDKFGILIKVKFRQSGQLQVLSAHHQSGGERSVSTILYLVSLQDITNCPFRVVDEINQGMDPINERKMFQQLVRSASQPNTPQCFLLTPKLLPDLVYSEACSILNIMNGPWIEHSSKAEAITLDDEVVKVMKSELGVLLVNTLPLTYVKMNTVLRENRVEDVDKRCKDADHEMVETILEIAARCTDSNPDEQPWMNQVLQMLEA